MSSRSGSGSESGSESEEEQFESIIATRQRRSNAGSRLRQLIQLEEEELEEQTSALNQQFTTEDDENVSLLFQEDENDQEFVESESDEEQEDEDEDEDDDQKGATDVQQSRKRQREEQEEVEADEEEGEEGEEGDDDDSDSSSPAVDSDEMLSESDMSDSDSDESEGERELRREEKERTKRQSKKSQIPVIKNKIKDQIPAIKDHTASPVKKKKRPAPSNIDLLSEERRSSSRKATVENKFATAKKLQEQEERRVAMSPKVQVEYVEKTLEERLKEAEETEKENTLSLTRFFEQEVDRKKKQREAALSKKKRLAEFVRLYSHGHYITPLDEVEEINRLKRIEEEELERIAKRKKRYGKKKKVVESVQSEETKLIELNTDPEIEKPDPEIKQDETTVKLEGDVETKTESDDKKDDSIKIEESEKKEQTLDPVDEPSAKVEVVEDTGAEADKEETFKVASKEENKADSTTTITHEEEKKDDNEEVTEKEEPTEDKMDVDRAIVVPEDQLEETEKSTNKEDTEQEDLDEFKEKKVTFDVDENPEGKKFEELPSDAANPLTSEDQNENSEQPEIIPEPEEEKIIYEGPPQFVAVNYISLEEFKEDLRNDAIKIKLFGEQSTWPAARRSAHVENICVIKSKAEDSIEARLNSIRNSRDSEFEKLMKLPKFGQVLKTVEDVVEVEEEEEEEIILNTPAPVGIYLPNGSKKKCVINGKPAAYYDPQNGVPYSSVESFKTLRDLQDDCYFWTQVDNGGNNSRFRAGVGCYFGKWKGEHAKGVPEGF